MLRRNKFLNLFAVMATGMRINDELDGAINFGPWKARIVLILEETFSGR